MRRGARLPHLERGAAVGRPGVSRPSSLRHCVGLTPRGNRFPHAPPWAVPLPAEYLSHPKLAAVAASVLPPPPPGSSRRGCRQQQLSPITSGGGWWGVYKVLLSTHLRLYSAAGQNCWDCKRRIPSPRHLLLSGTFPSGRAGMVGMERILSSAVPGMVAFVRQGKDSLPKQGKRRV